MCRSVPSRDRAGIQLGIGALAIVLCCVRKYYLVDFGYANTDRFLAPYRGERYHLSQFDVNAQPRRHRGPRDLYNHRHAQLRNVVEKAFGILKRRLKVLRQATPFPYKVQCHIALACCVIHNFIKRHQGTNRYFNMQMDSLPMDDALDESSAPVGPDERTGPREHLGRLSMSSTSTCLREPVTGPREHKICHLCRFYTACSRGSCGLFDVRRRVCSLPDIQRSSLRPPVAIFLLIPVQIAEGRRSGRARA
uniref:DDE Tnp4 domain-containing protein n=1 Tax=Ananas comosus var. bracteatus TaxID=296719 RepID=A0A6V7QBM8_ANACO|nr:unnamed protein product [Ananas comosus var. bracteatus]